MLLLMNHIKFLQINKIFKPNSLPVAGVCFFNFSSVMPKTKKAGITQN